jgi:hypothetical protein
MGRPERSGIRVSNAASRFLKRATASDRLAAMGRKGLAVALATAAALCTAASAEAATVEIGSVAQIDGNVAPGSFDSGSSAVQANAAAGHTFTVPAGYGVITRYRHRTGTGSGTLKFKVLRPTGNLAEYRVVASESHAVTAGTTESFDTRVQVQPGDVLGLTGTTGVQEAYDSADGSDTIGTLLADAGVGETTSASPEPNHFLDVAARIETDADGDGYGDDTQDECPADPSKHTGCGPVTGEAETKIDSTPAKVVKTKKKRKKVKFTFSSPQAGTTFECSFDGAGFAPCSSPLKKKLRRGKHTFEVRAVNASGTPDPSPASYSFKIKRKRHH